MAQCCFRQAHSETKLSATVMFTLEVAGILQVQNCAPLFYGKAVGVLYTGARLHAAAAVRGVAATRP